MTAPGAPPDVARHPLFTNPHIRMCAVITAVIERGADIEAYGRVSEQIMDICGLDGWARLDTRDAEHPTAVPRCAAYREAYEAIGAPRKLCAIPFEWDDGCLDRINPALEAWPTACAFQDAGECIYTIRPRAGASTPARTGAAAPAAGFDDWDVTVAGA
jgi:hypothetical protein